VGNELSRGRWGTKYAVFLGSWKLTNAVEKKKTQVKFGLPNPIPKASQDSHCTVAHHTTGLDSPRICNIIGLD
jgi:hypothetical protein